MKTSALCVIYFVGCEIAPRQRNRACSGRRGQYGPTCPSEACPPRFVGEPIRPLSLAKQPVLPEVATLAILWRNMAIWFWDILEHAKGKKWQNYNLAVQKLF